MDATVWKRFEWRYIHIIAYLQIHSRGGGGVQFLLKLRVHLLKEMLHFPSSLRNIPRINLDFPILNDLCCVQQSEGLWMLAYWAIENFKRYCSVRECYRAPSFAGLGSALTHDTNSLVKYCRCLQDKKESESSFYFQENSYSHIYCWIKIINTLHLMILSILKSCDE